MKRSTEDITVGVSAFLIVVVIYLVAVALVVGVVVGVVLYLLRAFGVI